MKIPPPAGGTRGGGGGESHVDLMDMRMPSCANPAIRAATETAGWLAPAWFSRVIIVVLRGISQ